MAKHFESTVKKKKTEFIKLLLYWILISENPNESNCLFILKFLENMSNISATQLAHGIFLTNTLSIVLRQLHRTYNYGSLYMFNECSNYPMENLQAPSEKYISQSTCSFYVQPAQLGSQCSPFFSLFILKKWISKKTAKFPYLNLKRNIFHINKQKNQVTDLTKKNKR